MIFFDSISIQILSGVKIVIKQLKADKRRRLKKKKSKDFLAGGTFYRSLKKLKLL